MNAHDYIAGVIRHTGFIVKVVTNTTDVPEGGTAFTALNLRCMAAGDGDRTYYIDAVGFNTQAFNLAQMTQGEEFDCLTRIESTRGRDGVWRLRSVVTKILSALPSEAPTDPRPKADEEPNVPQDTKISAQDEYRAAQAALAAAEEKLASQTRDDAEQTPLPGFKKDGSFDLRTKVGREMKLKADAEAKPLPPRKPLRKPRVSAKVGR